MGEEEVKLFLAPQMKWLYMEKILNNLKENY